MRVLDELADAFHAGRGGCTPRPILSSIGLAEQLGFRITPAMWCAVEHRLGCQLPPLEFNQGHWFQPAGLATVWDMAAWVARSRPDLEPPVVANSDVWQEAQLFAGVRAVLVETGNLDPTEVTRPARLMADLGLE